MKIKSFNQWELVKSSAKDVISVLYEKSLINDDNCRVFLIFCANQIYDFLNETEKEIVLLSEQYMFGELNSTKELFKKARELSAVALSQPITLEGKFNASKAAIAAATGMCNGQPLRSLYRAMDRASYEVMVLHTMNETKSGDDFIKPSPESICSIGLPYSLAQVEKLKELFGNPF